MHGAPGLVRPARVRRAGGVTTAWVWYGFARKGKRQCLEPDPLRDEKKSRPCPCPSPKPGTPWRRCPHHPPCPSAASTSGPCPHTSWLPCGPGSRRTWKGCKPAAAHSLRRRGRVCGHTGYRNAPAHKTQMKKSTNLGTGLGWGYRAAGRGGGRCAFVRGRAKAGPCCVWGLPGWPGRTGGAGDRRTYARTHTHAHGAGDAVVDPACLRVRVCFLCFALSPFHRARARALPTRSLRPQSSRAATSPAHTRHFPNTGTPKKKR